MAGMILAFNVDALAPVGWVAPLALGVRLDVR